MKFGTIRLHYIKNPFEPIESKETRMDLHGSPIKDYLEGFCLGQKYLVSLNGELIEDFSIITKPNDELTYTPIIARGGGGKDILRLVSLVALAIYAPTIAGSFFAQGTAGYFAVQAGVMVAGGLLVNAIMPPTTPNISSNPELESDSYSWDGVTTNRDLNKPIPVLYGTARLGGTVINQQFDYDQDEDWLRVQLALCHGEIKGIEPQHIQVGGASFSSVYTNSVDGFYKYKIGRFDQGIMTGFDDTSYNNATVTQKLDKGVWYEFESKSTSIDKFKLHFEFPKGLFTMDKQGNVSEKEVQYKVEYREKGSGTWIPINQRVIVYKTQIEYTDIEPKVPQGGGGSGGSWFDGESTTSSDGWGTNGDSYDYA